MKRILTILALLISGAVYAQVDTVKPYMGDYTPMMGRGYKFKSLLIDSSLWLKAIARFDDSVSFGKKAYTTTPPMGDSSYEVVNTMWVKQNVAPGIPGNPAAAWSTSGNWSPSDPTPYRLGYLDSFPTIFINNGGVSMVIPEGGIRRRVVTPARSATKAMIFDTATKRLYYDDYETGGNPLAYVNSYVDTSINALILIRDNGGEDTIYYVGGGGGSGGVFDTTYIYNAIATKLNISDTSGMLSPYLRSVDTTNQWYANASKINDSTYRFYKGTGFFDVIVPVSSGGGGDNIYNSNGTLTGSRTVDGNGNNIHFDDMGDFNVTAAGGLVLNGATYGVGIVGGLFSLNMPSGSSTDSIVVWDASTLQFKVRTQTSGGSPTPDTVYAKFPIQVDTSGVKDSIVFKLPPESVPVNLHPTDTLEAQFMKVRRQLLTTLSDTVRWNTTGATPSGTPEVYYRWSQAGALVNLQVWAYYPTNGTSVTGAAITLPPDVPVPNYPAGWLAGDLIIAQGTGGIYVNRTRTFSELSTSSAECVLKRDNGNTRWELQNKSGNVSARYAMWNIVYETSDY